MLANLPKTVVHYVSSIAICILTTLVAIAILPFVDLANVVMLFLLAVFLIAVYISRSAGVFSAFLSVALFDYFCVPPRFTFAVNDVQYLFTFIIMLAVALITGQLAANLRAQALLAKNREHRTQALYEMARALSGSLKISHVCEITVEFLRKIVGMESVLLLPEGKNELVPAAPHKVWYEPHMAWAAYHGEQNHLLAEPDGIYYLPLNGSTRVRGVLVLSLPPYMPALSDENRALLLTVASLVAIAVERLHYVEVAKEGEMQITTERLRSSILSALSHDLRTPLTVLVGMADSLAVGKPPLTTSQQEIAQTLRDQSIRLSSMVTNLLDMARLRAGKVVINKEWQPLEEVIGASIQILGKTLEPHAITVTLPDELPMLEFDAVLMERVFCNLLENAAKYSQPDGAIEIAAQLQDSVVAVSISDHGCGIPHDKLDDIFAMFVRGHTSESVNNVAGTGIGLAVCKAIIEAHQGTIKAKNNENGGACICFTLPIGTPPSFDESLLEREMT